MPFLKDSLFLISFWKTGTSRAAHSSQDWDCEKGHLLGFLSVTPFSDLLLKGNLFSYAHLPQNMECFLALSRLLFAWLCFCSFFFFYCLKMPCMKIHKHAFLQIKHPCFEMWVPCFLLLVHSSPWVSVYKDCDKWRPNRDLVNALSKQLESTVSTYGGR